MSEQVEPQQPENVRAAWNAETGRPIDNGGPAYPVISTEYEWNNEMEKRVQILSSSGGMTLRDAFAIHAPITLADAQFIIGERLDIKNQQDRAAIIAVLAHLRYNYADEMIVARKPAT